MSKNSKLQKTFDLDNLENLVDVEETTQELINITDPKIQSIQKIKDLKDAYNLLNIDKVHDDEMDKFSNDAKQYSEEIFQLGMDVEPRHSAEMFNASANMLKIAIDAKNAKIEKKVKFLELELKRKRQELDEHRAGLHIEENNDNVVFEDRESLLDSLKETKK